MPKDWQTKSISIMVVCQYLGTIKFGSKMVAPRSNFRVSDNVVVCRKDELGLRSPALVAVWATPVTIKSKS